MNKLTSLLVALLVPATLTLAGCGAGQHAGCPMPSNSQQALRSVTVVGQGEASGTPDVARTSLGVEASAPTVQDAMDQTTAKMKAILEGLKKMGVAEKDIKTANFSISIERPYGEPPPPYGAVAMEAPAALPAAKPGKVAAAPIAPSLPPRPVPAAVYHVNNTIEVVIRDVPKASSVLQAAVEAGANSVWSVNFGIDNPKPLEASAREKAVEDARARAEALAKLEGMTLGKVISVSEVLGRGPMPPMPMYAAIASEAKMGGPSLSPGEVTVGMSLEVVFALEK